MGLFKSKEDRRIEREIQVRKAINAIKQNIKNLHKHERQYIEKARRAKRLGSNDQVEFLKKTIKKTIGQRIMLERQLLNIETAAQIKSQAESHAQFARAMNAVSSAIAETFGSTDMIKTQRDFEKAMAKAETLEQQMDLFLSMSSESMFGYEPDTTDEVVSDADIDRLLEEEAVHEEESAVEKEIAEGLSQIERELRKDKS